MSNRENSEEYQLVLESVDSSDSAMLTRVRGILLGSLELNVEEAKHVLENIPLTIKRSPNEKDLLIHFNSLKEAGARVLLLKPAVKTTSAASHSNNTGNEETLEF